METVYQSLAQLTTTSMYLQINAREEGAELDISFLLMVNYPNVQTIHQANILLVLKMKTVMNAYHAHAKQDGNATETVHALNAQHTLF